MPTVTVCDNHDLGSCGGECYRCRLDELQKRFDKLVQAVTEMRDAQRNYWRNHRKHDLFVITKEAEKKVDRLLEEIRNPPLI